MTNEARSADAPSGAAAQPNLIQRVVMVFGSPTKLGESLRRQSPWFWTLAIVAVISLIIFFFLPEDLLRQAIESQAARRPQAQGQTQDPAAQIQVARLAGAAGALIGTFIAAAVIAGALYLVFNVLQGGETAYRQHMSAVAHIFWITLLGSILLLPIWISKGDMQIKLGLGLLLAEAPSSFVGHFLNGITIFGLWGSAALGAVESGLSGGRISVGKSVGTVLGLYLVWVIVQAAWGTITGGALG